jgi:hypothetical protein
MISIAKILQKLFVSDRRKSETAKIFLLRVLAPLWQIFPGYPGWVFGAVKLNMICAPMAKFYL